MPPDSFGRIAEGIARFMGTPMFLVWMTIICAVWLAWNTLAPVEMQFDPRELNFTLLTLILSLQASYAAPLLLLADNRSANRDRVEFEADRHAETPTQGQGSRSSSASAQGSRRTKPGLTDGARFA
jgi:uncharacterized membrane protein